MTDVESRSTPQQTVRPYLLTLGLSWLGMLARDLVEFGLPSPQNSLLFYLSFSPLLLGGGGCLTGAKPQKSSHMP